MNKIFFVAFFLSLSFSIFLIAKCVLEIRERFSLDQAADATVFDWRVVEKTPSDSAVRASYYFFYKGRKVAGETEFTGPYFPSPGSAERAVREMSPQKWDVFFSSRNPERNSLQKVFPFLLCIRAFLWGSLCVFLILWSQSAKRRKG